MKKIILIVFILFSSNFVSAQTISCDDLYNYKIENGYKKATIQNYTMNSEWLYTVTAYSYDYKIYVVAEIKRDQYAFKTSTYIFCGIPSQNWQNFQYGGYGDSDSYGVRFNKYIMDYKCSCD